MRILPAVLATALLTGCGTMEIGERNLIRPTGVPAPAAPLAASLGGGALQEEEIVTGDGATLRGVSLRADSSLALLYFGGNAFNLDQHGKQALRALASCGVNVTLFDYRGYGRSSGTPSVALMAADGVRAFDKLNAVYPGRVIVHGQSLGSFIAAHVARERPQVHGLVLESTSSTVQEWADARLPWFMRATTRVAVEPALRVVDNVQAAASYAGPALVMMGGRDRVTPPHLARKVFDALPAKSKLWVQAAQAGHNDVLGNAEVMPAYCGFIRSLR